MHWIPVLFLGEIMVNTTRLAEVGPIDPETGFPLWYKDGNGVRLELVWKPGDLNAPAVGEPPEDTPPLGLPERFPEESFYMLAETSMVISGGTENGEVRVVLALEATFGGNEAVADGQQIVFGRIRFRVRDGVPLSDYTLTHPYGTVTARTDDRGRVTATQDIGVTPVAFEQALAGEIAPFLTWDPPESAPPGYIGDGRTLHRITGSPMDPPTNFARVEGPGVGTAGEQPDPEDPGNIDKVYTEGFVLQGRLATTVGVDVRRAVYFRDAAGTVTVDVFARSEPGQTLEVTGTDLTAAPLQGGTDGNYLARTTAGDVPTEVTVTNRTDDPPWPQNAPVTDAVEITEAVYDRAAGALTVTAASSDEQSPPELTLTGRGLPENTAPGTLDDVDAPPAIVTVRSARGGSATRHVTVVG